MTHLFARAGYTVGIAHCNFRLRGADADADEALVNRLARQLGVPFYATAFDTEGYAREQGISIQMAARDLRYDWLETIRVSQDYDFIAVAQHRNDHVETMLLNLVRGTGLGGLRGILPERGSIIRPLLFLTAEEVMAEVARQELEYRDDASNFSTKYARNKIRLEVIPKLKELNPALERTMAENMAHFTDAHTVLQQYIADMRNRLFEAKVEEGEEEWHIPIAALAELHPQRFMLFELFKPYGFTEAVLADLATALPGIPGKQFASPSHMLYVDRGVVVLKRHGAHSGGVTVINGPGSTVSWGSHRFEPGLATDTTVRPNAHVAQFDADRLVFPLQIRSWHTGDTFHPLGMKGSKKLSDFFVSLKIPVHRKAHVPVVVNGNGDILWVVPYRMDNRYKITAETKKVFTLAHR